jgi:capsular exopolysaccharide synthesis family protein
VVTLLAHGSFAADQYEALRHVVEREAEGHGSYVVAMTSPAPGDGKTLTSVNLAVSLARRAGTRVLVVDADVRRPSVLALLGLDESVLRGLTGVAQDPSVALSETVRYCRDYRLFILPAGAPTTAPYDVLSSPAVGRLLSEARRHFHFVVIDTPPAVGFPDYRLLEKWADGSFLVVSEGVTPRNMLELALEIVDRQKAKGIVLNRADVRGLERYYGSYYRSRRAHTAS